MEALIMITMWRLLKLKNTPRLIFTAPICTKIPYPTKRVRIYQYPLDHPLQKMSEEYADFIRSTHQCVTLSGSSGSSLRQEVSPLRQMTSFLGWSTDFLRQTGNPLRDRASFSRFLRQIDYFLKQMRIEEIVGVHHGGILGNYNGFIPINELTLKIIDSPIY